MHDLFGWNLIPESQDLNRVSVWHDQLAIDSLTLYAPGISLSFGQFPPSLDFYTRLQMPTRIDREGDDSQHASDAAAGIANIKHK